METTPSRPSVEFLKNFYLEKREKNRNYSLRSFARDLGVSHAFLSLLFSGQRKLTPSQAAQMGLLLGLSADETRTWTEQSVIDASKDSKFVNPKLKRESRMETPGRMNPVHDLQIDLFKAITHWKYFAILEATYLNDTKASVQWFAKRLGLTTIETSDAIGRLLELEMLEKVKGKFKKTKDLIKVSSKNANTSARAYNQSVIQKALDTLKDSSEEAYQGRWISGGTVAIERSKINKAREKLKRFQDEFLREFGAPHSDEVYQMNLQFFPVSKTRKAKTNP